MLRALRGRFTSEPSDRRIGTLTDRIHRQLTDADLEKIVATIMRGEVKQGSRGGAEDAERALLLLKPPHLRVSA